MRTILLTLGLAIAAHAELLTLPVLNPGATTSVTDDTTDHNGTLPIGIKVAGFPVQPFSMTAGGITTSGQLLGMVFFESPGTDTLDFYLQVDVTAGALTSIDYPGFGRYTVRAGTVSPVQLLGPGGLAPDTVTRSAGTGDVITWNFGASSLLGNTDVLVISTNSGPSEKATALTLFGAGGSETALSIYAPVPIPAPEPGTVGLVILGLCAIAGCARPLTKL